MAKAKGIMLYFDIKEPLKDFSDEERGKLVWALLEYGENHTAPQFSGSLKTAFNFIKKDIDRDIEKYFNRCQKNKENISKRYNCIQSNTTVNDRQQSLLNKDKNKNKNKIKENNNLLFAQFWDMYPKKKDKQSAEKAFKKLNPDEALLKTMLNAIEEQKKSAEWQKDNGQYIPHPSTWLNGHRWEDEINIGVNKQQADEEFKIGANY